MIYPEQIKEKNNGTNLLILFEDTNTIIAEINKERIVTFSKDFEASLALKTVEKIHHIAKYYDDGLLVETSSEQFDRLMNFRPEIKINDICSVINDKRRKITDNINYYKIIVIKETHIVIECLITGQDFDVPIDCIILHNEYVEKLFYIQNGYVGNAIYWHAKDSKGYTTDINKAHKFKENDAFRIVDSNGKNEQIWDCDYIDNNKEAHVTVIDMQYLKTEI